ncbi:hypothetical protein FRB98_000895 [Tulasnella sp. 332]|nr:hypothetical protein FRB98_000895 [Tulasnella sp. 332]
MSNPAAKTSAQPPATKSGRKTRQVRRRGPARNDEDDDIIERAALSGTESDISLSDGDPESEDEGEDEGINQTATGLTAEAKVDDVTPGAPEASTTPPLTDAATPPHANGTSSNEASHIWSDMVATEQIEGKHNDESDLPVIDFADLLLAPVDEILNKAEAAATIPASASAVPEPTPNPAAQPAAPVIPKTHAKPKSVAARETYLAKLKDDPAYTPRVGQFWGHDDRLMDKELRGMSDWWKGRWTGRGRGGGRGGFAGRGGRGGRGGAEGADGTAEPREMVMWSHDGYEELIRQGEGRHRGRRGGGVGLDSTQGWFKEREGRGGRGGSGNGNGNGGARGGQGSSSSSTRGGGGGQPVRSNMQNEIQAQLQAQAAAQIASSTASASKANQAQTPATAAETTPVAGSSTAAATPPVTKPPPKAPKAVVDPKVKVKSLLAQASMDRAAASAKSVVAQAKDEVAAAKSNDTDPPTSSIAPAAASVVTPAPVPSSVRVNLPRPPPTAPKAMRQNQHQGGGPSGRQRQAQMQTPAVSVPSKASLPAQNLTFGTAEPAAATKIPSPSISSHPTTQPDPAPAPSPSTQPLAPPSLQPNPGYSYVALPPGIAMGESGLLYEVATGRPVVLNQPQPQLPQPTPPPSLPLPPPPPAAVPQPQPAPMYNPRPILHSQTAAAVGARSFIPQHVLNTMPQHTPDLGGGGHGGYPYGAGSPTPPGGDSSRATPTFFAPPRSGGKVQIRAPDSASTAAKEKPLYASSPISPTYQSQHPHQQRPSYDQTYYGGGGNTYYNHNPLSSQQNTGGATPYAVSQGDDGYYGGAYYPQQPYGAYNVGPPGGDYGFVAAGGMVGDGLYVGSAAYPTQDNRDVHQPQQHQQHAVHGFQQGQQVYY